MATKSKMVLIEAKAPYTSYRDPAEDVNWNHFGCPECGNVWKLPETIGAPPYCAGHGDNYCYAHWAAKFEELPEDWVLCVPVKVYEEETNA